MDIVGIIPARYASSRFPGKPLALINGLPMIQRVYQQASKVKSLNQIIVATDDERIKKAVENFGGQAMLTSPDHQSGTDRCNEVYQILKSRGISMDVVVNIQGDEPYINPGQIDELCNCFSDKETGIATLAKKISNNAELVSPNVNKVIFNLDRKAIYFSRHPIPFQSKVTPNDWLNHFTYFKHIGLYAYRVDILEEISRLKQSSLEKAESLEQLRWLENGYSITVAETEFDSMAVDVPEDISKFSNMS